jgi:hypothetical protein
MEDSGVHVSETKRLVSLLDTQRAKLLEKNLSGDVPDGLYDKQMAQFAEREAVLRESLARYEETSEQIDLLVKKSSEVLRIISSDWLKMDRRARHLALSALFGGFRLEGRTLIPENKTRLELFRAS